MSRKFLRPCRNCPFKVESRALAPRDLLSMFDKGVHEMEIDYACSSTDSGRCVGADIYAQNTCKLPRDREHAKRVLATMPNKVLVYATRSQMRGDEK